MNLGDLVTHTRESYLRDMQAPFLWPASELIKYLNEAETLFARHTHVLTDDASSVTTLTTEVGKSRYALGPLIVFVYEVYDDTGWKLRNVTRSKLPKSPYEGKPRMYTLDSGVSSIRLAPLPDDEYEFTMLVARKPLKAMSTQYDEPEIPEEYHLALCDYAAYKAVRNNDTEASNVSAGANFREDWEIKLRDAKRDAFHLRMGATPKVVNNWTMGRR